MRAQGRSHNLMLIGKNKRKMGKKALCLIFAFLLSINSFAAVVSDNDGAAFVTKAEFEALKENFASQVTQYNTSIDSKIDGAIANYLAGINLNKKVLLDNVYDKLGCGKKWLWGNNTGTRTEYPYGGCSVIYWKSDTLAQRYGTASYDYTSWNNILFLGDRNTNKISETPYEYTINVNEADWDHYYQNASQINGDRSRNQYGGWSDIYRDGIPKFYYSFRTSGSIEAHLEWGAIREKYSATTTKGTFSINRASNEYYIDLSGDENGTLVSVENYSGKGTVTGDFPNKDNQTWKKKWRPSWGKYAAHNQLRIEEWEKQTRKIEKIISGTPVAYIEKNETNLVVKYKSDKVGTLYIYDSADPVPYSALVASDLVKIVSVETVNTELSIEIKDCVKDSWIRAMFLPTNTSDVANLTIISVEAEVM